MSEIPTHHRVRSLGEGPSGFVPVDSIRNIRRPFFRHRGGKRADLFRVESGALDTEQRRLAQFADNDVRKSVCAPGPAGLDFRAVRVAGDSRGERSARFLQCSRVPDIFLAARRCDAPGTRSHASIPVTRRAREPIESRVPERATAVPPTLADPLAAVDHVVAMVASEGSPSLRVGDVDCPTVKDEPFSAVRRAFGIADDFLAGLFDFGSLGAGGGKGGDLMSRTTCGTFFVKELNAGDASSLLRDAFLEAYVDLITTKTSLLCKIVAVVAHPSLGRFLVMANCLPTRVEAWSGLYDLKGSADDKALVEDGERVPEVHKRCWNVPWMLCEATGCNKGVPASRTRYLSAKRRSFNFPIYVTKEQRLEILSAVKRDVALFDEFGLMDYSMIVGVQRPPPGEAARCLQEARCGSDARRLHGKPYASRHGGDSVIVYFGIIDFLQAWTGGKRCAHVIKACCAPPPISTISPGAYAKQFREFFQWKLRGVAHSLPPAYVHVGEGGEVAGAHAAKLAEQIEALRGDPVSYTHLTLPTILLV